MLFYKHNITKLKLYKHRLYIIYLLICNYSLRMDNVQIQNYFRAFLILSLQCMIPYTHT
jgi:hypothetical protein